MVSSVALAMVLAFEPTEHDVMQRPPRSPREPMLSGFVLWRIGLVSGLFTAGIFGAYQWALQQGHGVEHARTLAVNTLVAMEVCYLFSVRYLKNPSFHWQGVRGTPRVLAAVGAVAVLQSLFTYVPLMQALFHTQALPGVHLALACGIGAAVLVLLELEKAVLRRLLAHSPTSR
jgi:magnesium-transporting ATPase (P-type)